MDWTPKVQRRTLPHPSPTRRRPNASSYTLDGTGGGSGSDTRRIKAGLPGPSTSRPADTLTRFGRLGGGENAWIPLAGVACGVILWLLVGPPNPSALRHANHHGKATPIMFDENPATPLPTPPAGGDGAAAASYKNTLSAETIHIAITTTMSHAVGVLGVINSTFQHAADPSNIHFHLIAPRADAPPLELLVHSSGLFHGGSGGRAGQQAGHASFYDRIEVHVDTTTTKAAVHNTESESRLKDLSQNIVYARYYFAETFPTLKRIIYFDADLVVLDDVAKLWSVDLKGKPVGAVKRCRTKMERNFMFHSPNAKKYLKRYNPKTCTFNNGVMLYDLEEWRANGYHKQLVVWTELNAKKPLYTLGSQPPFNLVFYENYHELDPSWNVMDAGEPTLQPSKQEIASAKVLHWNGGSKPWAVIADGDGSAAPATRSKRVLSSEMFTRALPRWESVVVAEKFTVVIVTQGLRQPQLAAVLKQLDRCSTLIHEVLLVWNNAAAGCPAPSVFEEAVDGQLRVRCLLQAENQMQNRLLIAEHLETEAAFHHDDDVVIDVDSIALAFKVWRRNRNAVVGYQPRVHLLSNEKGSSLAWRYEFHLTEGYYTFVIGKAFFVSRTLMQQYAAAAALVELNRDKACEDLAINLLAAQQPGSNGCIVVESSHRELERSEDGGGLSTQISAKKWARKRQACLSHLSAYFTNDFLKDGIPRSTKVAIGYDHIHNEIVYRNVVPMESVCSDTRGIKRCRIHPCDAALDMRPPCYSPKR